MRQGRHARQDRARRHAPLPGDSGLARQDRTVPDRDMVGDPDLARERDAAAEPRGSADAGLPAEDRVLADDDVVADLHEVVDLRPAADDGLAEGRAVDRRVGPDLDVVPDPHDPDLGDLAVRASVPDVPEAVRADDGSRLEDAARSEPASREHAAFGCRRQSSPISAPSPTKAPAMSTVRAPTRARAETVAPGRPRRAPSRAAVRCTKEPRCDAGGPVGRGPQGLEPARQRELRQSDDDAGFPARRLRGRGTSSAPARLARACGRRGVRRRPRTDPTGPRPRGSPRPSAGPSRRAPSAHGGGDVGEREKAAKTSAGPLRGRAGGRRNAVACPSRGRESWSGPRRFCCRPSCVYGFLVGAGAGAGGRGARAPPWPPSVGGPSPPPGRRRSC